MIWKLESNRPITVESKLAFVGENGVRGYRSVRWNEFRQPKTYGPIFAVDYVGVYMPDGSNTGEEPKVTILDESPTESR